MNYTLVLWVFLSMVFFTIGVKYNVNPLSYGSRFGYSSKRSLATNETWVEANTFMGKLFMVFSLIFMIIIVVFHSFNVSFNKIILGSVFYLFVASRSIFVLIESYLKRRFFRDGKRRPNSLF
jgi:hypothetical protein